MAAKKKQPTAPSKRAPKDEPRVDGTPRTHRAVDAGKLRESVKQKRANGAGP